MNMLQNILWYARWEMIFFFLSYRRTWWIGISMMTVKEAQGLPAMLINELCRQQRKDKDAEFGNKD
jgi:hypothetical protein